ncbi:hypothetical protein LT85_2819 [Collimonas arenae]|uniref:Uncharacterized protein n=1 Tax=Collimonas arenae TaxID=279058 RepID=A0A0A1FGF9_9BURK|nr:hypothetical protein LT85_2819 [Collimonas arenae]
MKGTVVRGGNLRKINPNTGKRNTVVDIVGFFRNYIGLDYIF